VPTTTKESPYRRPYKSHRRRASSKLDSTKKDGKMLLRLLGVLVVVLIMALALIFKDVGKSQVAADPVTVGAIR
jgi:cytoskeletal protein RodZ